MDRSAVSKNVKAAETAADTILNFPCSSGCLSRWFPPALSYNAGLLVTLLSLGLTSLPANAGERSFPDDAVVNMTQAPYQVVPDDGNDDTEAIQRAITDHVGTGRILYFPNGVYEISDSLKALNHQGLWDAHLTFYGQSREHTVFQLRDSAPGFADAETPKAMVMTGSYWEAGDGKGGGGNKAFRNFFFNMTFDVGKGNPGAIGIEWAVSNWGAIEDVSFRSKGGEGHAGIAMLRKIPGPGLIRRVSVTGFDYGMDVGDVQYGFTVEDLELRDQRKAGIRVSQNLLHIRDLRSVNEVPAILVTRSEAVVTLVDSTLSGGSSEFPAIDCEGQLMLRHVTVEGYRDQALRFHGNDMERSAFAGWASQIIHPGKSEQGNEISDSLLAVRKSPEYWNPDLTDWQMVGERQEGESDDTAAIQRAIDSGKSTVYFSQDRDYFISDTVVVRGAVKHIFGTGSEISLGAAKEPFSHRENPRPLFRIDPTDGELVVFENLFFNAQYPGEVLFENNSPRTVVIRHCGGWVGAEGMRRSYQNTSQATGALFVENVFLPGWEFGGQEVWARQLNPENFDGDGSIPQVTNSGGRLWILGFKTEGPAPFIRTQQNGTTELLGGYNYISATALAEVPEKAVPYEVIHSKAALSFLAENFRENDYPVYIRYAGAEKDAEETEVRASQLPRRFQDPNMRSHVVPYSFFNTE